MTESRYPRFSNRPKLPHPTWGDNYNESWPYQGNTTYDEDMTFVMETIKEKFKKDMPKRMTPKWFRDAFPDKLLFLSKYGAAGECLYEALYSLSSGVGSESLDKPSNWHSPDYYDRELLSAILLPLRHLVKPYFTREPRNVRPGFSWDF